MSALVVGAHIVGPNGTSLLEVWTSSGDDEHGWLEVRNLSMTDAQAAALLAELGAVEPVIVLIGGAHDGREFRVPDDDPIAVEVHSVVEVLRLPRPSGAA